MTRQKETCLGQALNLEPLLLNNRAIQKADYVKFLGILLDKNLDFKNHLHFTCTKISKGL